MAKEISTEKKIDIVRFVNGYKRVANDNLKEKYIADNFKIVKNYIPIVTKMAVCDNIISSTTRSIKRDLNGNIVYDDNGKPIKGDFYIDSTMRFLLFTMNMIDMYTNLKVDFLDIANDYDALNKVGLIQVLFTILPQSEISEFKTMLDMKLDDAMTNEYETKNYFKRLFNKAIELVEYSMISNLDNDKISDIVNNIWDFINNIDNVN